MSDGHRNNTLFPSSPATDLFKKKKNDTIFASETHSIRDTGKKWKILVVDDVPDVHASTHIILDGFTLEGRKIQILDAYSAREARELLENETDIALIFLDVVMETDDAGLKLVEYCRTYLKNPFIRIILRTGQPGDAPEEKVISDYDISNYWTKTELTSKKMLTVLTAELRNYKLMTSVDDLRQNLETKVRERTFELQELLDKTLKGSIKVLVEILAVINPDSFQNSRRYLEMSMSIIKKLRPEKAFETEIAAILSHIGCVAIPNDILEKKNNGEKLLPEEEILFNSHPTVGSKLLKNIPKMEDIASIINNQMNPYLPGVSDEQQKDIRLVSGILRLVMDYDICIKNGSSREDAWDQIKKKRDEYHPEVFNVMESEIFGTRVDNIKESVKIEELVAGPNIAEDIRDTGGGLIIGKGSKVSEAMLSRLNNYKKMDLLKGPVEVFTSILNNRFKLIKEIGEGGMGEVYLAEDLKLKRKVAVKRISDKILVNDNSRARFLREAQTASSLDHKNICTIFEINNDQQEEYIVMQYIDGVTIDQIINKKKLSIERIIEIIVQICDGMIEAHSKNVIHRDIKPSNIIIDKKGCIKILDFGLAKFDEEGLLSSKDEDANITEQGTIIGTFPYISPEQVEGKLIDKRSDIFSFGILFFEMLEGYNPFSAEKSIDTLHNIVNYRVHFKRFFPNKIKKIVQKTLEKKMEDRYKCFEDIRKDLIPFIKPGRSE